MFVNFLGDFNLELHFGLDLALVHLLVVEAGLDLLDFISQHYNY